MFAVENAPFEMLSDTSTTDYVVIRGRRLALSKHVNPKLFDPTYIAELKRTLSEAKPFPHLVLKDWFNEELLQLVREEFDLLDRGAWKVIKGDQEHTIRSKPQDRFGPAADIYFGIVNSGWFLNLISEITGLDDLMPDPTLMGGGMHESRRGGKFGIHRDFDRHPKYGLENRMVFITYLNRDWNPAWKGALELWNAEPPSCERSIEPDMGTSVLLIHGPESFHGHPSPLENPDTAPRRSVASYYYQNSFAVQQRVKRVTSVFLFAHKQKRLRRFASRLLPPALFDLLRKLA